MSEEHAMRLLAQEELLSRDPAIGIAIFVAWIAALWIFALLPEEGRIGDAITKVYGYLGGTRKAACPFCGSTQWLRPEGAIPDVTPDLKLTCASCGHPSRVDAMHNTRGRALTVKPPTGNEDA